MPNPETTPRNRQQETMAAAFQGLLKGDTTKRDRLMEDMEQARLLDAKERVLARLKAVDFLVGRNGVAVKSRDLLNVAL